MSTEDSVASEKPPEEKKTPPKKPSKATAKKSVSFQDLEAKDQEPEVPKATAEQDQESSVKVGDMLTIGKAVAAPVEPVETAQKVALPSTLDYVENLRDTESGSAFIMSVYGDGCFDCHHLVVGLKSDNEKGEEYPCHFRMGNQFCPAANHRIQIIGERERHLSSLRKAMASGDSNRILKQMNKLETLSLEDKSYVLRQVNLLPPQS